MGVEKRLLPGKEVFQLAQQPHQNQAKLVRALSRTYGLIQEYVEEAKESFVIKIYAALLHDRSQKQERQRTEANSNEVQFLVYQILNKFLGNMLENAWIDILYIKLMKPLLYQKIKFQIREYR